MKRLVLTVLAALTVAACTAGSEGDVRRISSLPRVSATLPPKVGAGVRVIVGGNTTLLRDNRSVIAVLARLLQLQEEYFAYQAIPAPKQVYSLLMDGGRVFPSRAETGGFVVAPQRQGPVVVAVVRVTHSGNQANVEYCEDRRHHLYFDARHLKAAPSPAAFPIRPHLMGIQFTWTDRPAVDGSTTGKARWLASGNAEFRSQDPACLDAVSKIAIPWDAPPGAPVP
jgi:hypothetical protein